MSGASVRVAARSLRFRIGWWESANQVFGDFEKFLSMGDLRFGLLGGHSTLTAIIARDAQLLSINEDTMEPFWHLTSVGEVLPEGGYYSRMFGEGHPVTFKEGLRDIEHRVIATRSGNRRKPVCQEKFRGSEAIS